ncbi:receptor-interacting serine/threonine-protein kinase 4-like [Watersipora subatra]|uniref:receptor-interacting serine/threonine-protein kinase 4-like n=1 Tax=Watersipora subatra TaxID=2589382 RepID=UPI00355C609F
MPDWRKVKSWLFEALGYGSPKEEPTQSAERRLLLAAEEGDVTSLVSLLESECSVNAFNAQGSTPLHLAVKKDNIACFELLLKHPQIDLQSLDKWGRTPLHTAVIWQRLDLLKRLVEHEPESVNVPDSDGKSLLHVASASGATEFVQYLLTTKIKKNSVDRRRWTPLVCAVAIQDVGMVRVLLEHGVGCNEPLQHNACMSALRLAIEKHNLDIVKLLLHYGAMVEFTVTVNLGSFSRSGGRRHNYMCHNLATVAIESVDFSNMDSLEIAYRVIQASPTAPDEDACFKMYEMYSRPSRRLQRTLNRDALQRMDNITPSDIAEIFRLMSIAFAVGIDLSKCNVERLKRKFRLDEKSDVTLYELVAKHQHIDLRLLAARSVRKQLIKAGNNNVTAAVHNSNLPSFVKELVRLEQWG